MTLTTFAQLPGLQKAKQILVIQEQITAHKRYAAILLQEFNDLMSAGLLARANRIQIICEWHVSQDMVLAVQLEQLNNPS